MSYAIIKLGGKQYKVSPGETLIVDKLPQEEGASFTVTDVLLKHDGAKASIGTPVVEKSAVKLSLVKHFKGDKIRVATYKAKSRYRKVRGHRQHLSKVSVVAVE